MRAELAAQKLQFMHREEGRREAEHKMREQEEERRGAEEERREAEHQMRQHEHKMREVEHDRQGHKDLLDEWEKLQYNIRLLRRDLRESTDEDTKTELLEDIEGLVRKKNVLSLQLGFK